MNMPVGRDVNDNLFIEDWTHACTGELTLAGWAEPLWLWARAFLDVILCYGIG